MEINQNDILGQEFARITGQEVLSQQEINVGRQTPELEQEEEVVVGTPEVAEVEDDQEEDLTPINAFFEKKHGKKYEEVAALLSRKSFDEEVTDKWGKPVSEVDETIKKPQVVEAELPTELLKKYVAYLKADGKEEDFIENLILQKSVGKMSAEELIKSDLKEKHKGATKEQLDLLYKADFKMPKPLDDSYTEEEIEERNEEIAIAQTKLDLRANEIREGITARATKALDTPLPRTVSKEEQAEIDKRNEVGARQAKQVFDTLDKYKNLEIQVVEKDEKTGKDVVSTLTYTPTKEQLEQVNFILQNPYVNFYKSFVDKDDNVDAQGLIDAVVKRVVGNPAIQEMAKDFKHEGKKAIIKGLKNADFKTGEITKPVTGQKKRNEELTAFITG